MDESPKVLYRPEVGKREAAINLALTEARHVMQQVSEYVFPWRGPSEAEMLERLAAAIKQAEGAMLLDFDRWKAEP